MNILCVSEYSYPRLAGGELGNWRILTELKKRGHSITIITSRPPGFGEHDEINSIKIERPFPSFNINNTGKAANFANPKAAFQRVLFAARLYPFIKYYIQRNKIDIIFNVGYITALPVGWAAHKLQQKSILSIHSYSGFNWFRLTNPLFATICIICERIVVRMSKYTLLCCPSELVAQELKTISGKECRVIGNPLDLEEFLPQNATCAVNIKSNLGIKQGELFLLYVGSLIRVKNLIKLVETVSHLHVDFKLIMIGEGSERRKIEKRVKRLGLQERITFVGEKTHKETLQTIAACDALLLASISEVFPNVVLEALNIGIPVISTKVGGIQEINSKNLYLVNRLMELNSLLENGIWPQTDSFSFENFSKENVAKAYEQMFVETLNEN